MKETVEITYYVTQSQVSKIKALDTYYIIIKRNISE